MILSMVMILNLGKNGQLLEFYIVEMGNFAQLYTTAAKHNVRALTLLTISDSLVTGEATSAEERQTTFNDMIKISSGNIAISI